MYYVYPALFKPNSNGGYVVTVPDISGCVTGGNTLEETMKMVKDALCGCLCVLEDEKLPPKSATAPNEIKLENNEFVALIEADTTKYRSKHDNKSIRKNVSLPAWLNAKAEQANLNCSQLLQKAIKEELQITL